MANFDFLLEKPEYSSFAQTCVNAENIWKDSPSSCVSGTRSALEGAIKWIYLKDSSLHFARSAQTDGVTVTDLFDRMESESFKSIVPQQILAQMNQIRRLANKVLHENYPVTSDDAMRCLHNLFDFINWLDSRYGINHIDRTFSRGSVPTNPSTFKTILKYAGAAVGGAAALILAAVLADDSKGGKKHKICYLILTATATRKDEIIMASILQNIGMTLAKAAISAFGAKNIAKTAVNNPKKTAKIVKTVIKSQIKKK